MLEKTNTHKDESKAKIEGDELLPHRSASPHRMLCLINSLHLVLVMPHLECCAQFWSPLYKTDVDRLQRVRRRATKILVTTLHIFSNIHFYTAIVIVSFRLITFKKYIYIFHANIGMNHSSRKDPSLTCNSINPVQ